MHCTLIPGHIVWKLLLIYCCVEVADPLAATGQKRLGAGTWYTSRGKNQDSFTVWVDAATMRDYVTELSHASLSKEETYILNCLMVSNLY